MNDRSMKDELSRVTVHFDWSKGPGVSRRPEYEALLKAMEKSQQLCPGLFRAQTQHWSDYMVLQSDVGITDETVQAAIAEIQRLGFDLEIIDSGVTDTSVYRTRLT